MKYTISYFYPTSDYANCFKLNGGYCVEIGERNPLMKMRYTEGVKGFASYEEALAFAKTIPNGYPSFFSLDHPSRVEQANLIHR